MHQFQRIVFVTAGSVIAAWTAVSAEHSGTQVVHRGQSIQAAVDAAAPGDTIVVRAGTYRENVTIQTNGLTLRAQGNVTLEPPHYSHGQCYLPGHAVGICVVPTDFDPSSGSYTSRVSDVTITGFRVVGFEGDGVFGFGTENLKVSQVVAIDNLAYGIASFDGIGTTFTATPCQRQSRRWHLHRRLTRGQRRGQSQPQLGQRPWHFGPPRPRVVVSDNDVWGNWLGVFLLADGQAGGSGEIAVLNNTVNANDDVCTQFAEAEFLPVLGGGGIVLAGSQHNTIFNNVVRHNQGDTLFSGESC